MSDSAGATPSVDDVLPSGELLEQGSTSRAASHGRRGLVVAATVAAVGLVGGAAVAASMYLSGGGVQPEDVMPAEVLAYVDLDLDPPAGQKVDLAALAARFADLDVRLGDSGGVRTVVLERLLGGSDVDAAEVEAWLGDRYGAAVLDPGTLDPGTLGPGIGAGIGVVLAIQVTDGEAATAWITQRLDGEGTVALVDGYVLVGSPGLDLDRVVAAAEAGPLSQSRSFREALDPLGDGVAQAYVDVPAIGEALGSGLAGLGVVGTPMAGAGTGPVGLVLRAEPDALELVGTMEAAEAPAGSAPSQLVTGIPDTTAVALAATGLGASLEQQWNASLDQLSAGLTPQQVDRELRSVERATGLSLPEDLVTLLGEDLVLTVDGADLAERGQVGLRVTTDPEEAARLVELLAPQVADATGGFGVSLRVTPDGYVVASTPDYAERLVAGDEGFLDLPAVRETLPDAAGSGQLAFVDFGPLQAAARTVDQDLAEALDPLRALGATGGYADGRWSIRMRLAFD